MEEVPGRERDRERELPGTERERERELPGTERARAARHGERERKMREKERGTEKQRGRERELPGTERERALGEVGGWGALEKSRPHRRVAGVGKTRRLTSSFPAKNNSTIPCQMTPDP